MIVGIIALGVAAVLALCLLGGALARPLLSTGTKVASEWQARLAADYPDWKQAGFNVRSWTSPDGSESEIESSFAIVPPDRDFSVVIIYKAKNGSAPILQDHVLTPGGKHHDSADSLLDYLESNCIAEGKRLMAVTSDEFGTVTVTWMREKRVGPFYSRRGSYDQLDYNGQAGEWRVLYSATP